MRSHFEERHVQHAAALSMIDRVHLRRPAFPGDQLRITITATRWADAAVDVRGEAIVDGETTARGRLVMAHRVVNGTTHPEAVRRAFEWMRGLERPAGTL
jgi:3-hydroxymyristoyl/3-hydroxydecanoyl-(acyl carrier protein) dehydratase